MLEQESKNKLVFNFDRIYLKDASFESPLSPQIFTAQDFTPNIDVQLNISHRSLDHLNSTYEVVLKTTVTAKTAGETVYLVEIQQAGAFTIAGFSDEQLEQLLEATCPDALFPFARESISNLVTNGGFPTLMLQPVNFETMYRQKKASQTDKSDITAISH